MSCRIPFPRGTGKKIKIFLLFDFLKLSFEDALCRDYATEAFFAPFGGVADESSSNQMILGVVPVVLGGANYSALGAPPHSYIDSADFASPKQLAHFLKLLVRRQWFRKKYVHKKFPEEILWGYICV